MKIIIAAVLIASAVYGADTATITGTVKFKGTPPEPKPIDFRAEKVCADMHTDKPAYEDVVVNKNGTLRWTLVYLKEGVTGEFKAPTEPVVMEQTGCIFGPHVVGVMVGQPIVFHNNDPTLHNVRTDSQKGQNFNIAQPIQGQKTTRKFKTEEIGIPLKCDVHFWMKSYIHVLSHPFFCVTGDDGSFRIKDVPPGAYTVEAWHEKLGAQTQKLTVKAGEAATADFIFEGK